MRLHICIFLAKLSIGSKEANSWTCAQFTRMERLCLEVLGILDNLLALHSSREFRLFTTPRWPETCMQSKSWSLASLTPLSHVPSCPAPWLESCLSLSTQCIHVAKFNDNPWSINDSFLVTFLLALGFHKRREG